MKPSTLKTLRLLRTHEWVTTHDLLQAEGIGARYSARIHELRHEHGCVIVEQRLKGRVSGSRYRLIGEPVETLHEIPSPSGESRAATASPGVDPSEGMANPAAGDASDSQHGLFDADAFTARHGHYEERVA